MNSTEWLEWPRFKVGRVCGYYGLEGADLRHSFQRAPIYQEILQKAQVQ